MGKDVIVACDFDNKADVIKFISLFDGDIGDQVRVMTPEQAKLNGSDYIVVGRPITQAVNPLIAYKRCVKEFVG